MNIQQLIQHCILAASLAGAAVCLAALFAYHFRNQLRKLHERWLGLGPLGRFATLGFVTVFVVYGSTKSPTNDLAGTMGFPGEMSTGGTGVSPVQTGNPGTVLERARCPFSQAVQSHLQLTTDNQQLTTLPAWHRRGAYSDWQRIDFPPSFAFPHGTNLLTSVTLFAWGEIREEVKVRGEGEQRNIQVSFEEEERDHHCSPSPSTFTLNLPTAVSLEPNVSMVSYGLTPSNSFLIAWQNACVNRSATNRIDASVELFSSGAITITTQRPGEAPSTNYQAPTPPPGFFGSDQDNAWALANFPDDYDAITNKGYEAWLMEDKVGINAQNGIYKALITINQQPTTNNQQPIYLVCGPYKVVVTSPGTYSFPLEVLHDYTARTYPIALPLSIAYDDGYRGGGESGSSSFAVPPRQAPRLLGAFVPHIYPIFMSPGIYVTPISVRLQEAQGTLISLWANVSGAVQWTYRSLSGLTRLRFTCPSEAEIEEAMVEDLVEIFMEIDGCEYGCQLPIENDHSGCLCGCAFGSECTCGSDCPWCHHNEDNDNGQPSDEPTP